jgi:NAD(P)-dependent dehydrogenase (short-subunit alcohol dehydrogenase family)
MFDLTGKVAVVTGGGGVLGHTFCSALAKQGADVLILDIRLEAAEELATKIKAEGGKAEAFECNVLDLDILSAVKDKILAKYKHIDILLNGAGGNMAGATIQPDQSLFTVDINAIRRVIDLNFFGILLPIRVFAEVMVKQGKGNIINITSTSVNRPLTRVMGYGAAKAAVKNLTEYLAVEFAQKYGQGLRVNALCPGFFLTEQNRFLMTNPDGTLTPRGNQVISKTPQGRMGEPQDLVAALIYLASDDSSFVTGTTTIVDGGFDAYSGV